MAGTFDALIRKRAEFAARRVPRFIGANLPKHAPARAAGPVGLPKS
jgi:hypothetical protein